MNIKPIAAGAALLLAAFATPGFAAPITLTFEGANNGGFITNFYNGGTDSPSNLSSQDPASGPNYHISFGGGVMALSNDEYFTYFTNAPSATVMSAVDSDALLSATGGFSFTDSLSFTYSSNEAFTIDVLGAGNTLLTTLSFAATNDSCSAETPFCVWTAATRNFSGYATSFNFANSGNIAAFDNVAVNEVPIPAAGWLFASGLAALGRMRRKRAA